MNSMPSPFSLSTWLLSERSLLGTSPSRSDGPTCGERKKGGYTSRPVENRDEISALVLVTSFRPKPVASMRQAARLVAAAPECAKNRTCPL